MARNLCGVCTRMPAPSPARGSAPTAPRCSRLTRIVSASSTILCDLRPLMSAINPTPQESFSSAGSNKPKPDASIVALTLPRRHPRTSRHRGSDAISRAQDFPVPQGEPFILEATFMPLTGRWLLVLAAVRRALAHRRPTRLIARLITNWDSNAVLYRTWQITDPDTSVRPLRARDFAHDRVEVDHGPYVCAMPDRELADLVPALPRVAASEACERTAAPRDGCRIA